MSIINGSIVLNEENGRIYVHYSDRMYQIDDNQRDSRGYKPKSLKGYKAIGNMNNIMKDVLNDDKLVDKYFAPSTPATIDLDVLKKYTLGAEEMLKTLKGNHTEQLIKVWLDDTTALGGTYGTSSNT